MRQAQTRGDVKLHAKGGRRGWVVVFPKHPPEKIFDTVKMVLQRCGDYYGTINNVSIRLQVLKTHLNVVMMWLLWAGMETAATLIASAWTRSRRKKRTVMLLSKRRCHSRIPVLFFFFLSEESRKILTWYK